MATARVAFHWPSDEELICEVRVSASYPDALNQAKTEAMAMFREGLAMLTPAEVDGE